MGTNDQIWEMIQRIAIREKKNLEEGPVHKLFKVGGVYYKSDRKIINNMS